MNDWFSPSGSRLLGASVLLFGVYGLTQTTSLLLITFAILLAFLGSLRIATRLANHLPKPLAKSIYWMHAAVFEAFAVAAFLFLRFTKSWSGRQIGLGPKSGRPILLVHGYLHNSSAWIYQKKKLIEKGFGPIYTLNLTPPFLSIQSYAETLDLWAKHIEQETGRKDLTLIGHSMGGLVSSFYALRLAPANKISDVITIGSPLAGTVIAKIGIGPNAREMERGSPLIKTLQEEIRAHNQTRFYHIATETDQIVVPFESAVMSGNPERTLILPDLGHASLLFSPRVADKITSWLRTDKD